MKVIDLFCGAGGFSVGLTRAGFEVVFANDIDKNSCKIFKANHSNTMVYEGDIRLQGFDDDLETKHQKIYKLEMLCLQF